MPDPKLLNASYVDGLVLATGSLSSNISTLQTATGVLRGDIDSNDTDISALQTATGVLSQVSVTGSSSIHAPDLTGVGQVTVTLDGSTVKISGASAGGGTPAGSDNQIQFNDGGSFGASANLTWDDNGLLANGYISGTAISGTSLTIGDVSNTEFGYVNGVTSAIQTQIDSKQDKDVTFNAQTSTSYTLVAGDSGKIVTMSNGSANTLTIPANSSVAFAVGTQITIIQKGAGQTAIAGAGGVTINSIDSEKKIASQYGTVTCVKEATDTWYLFGNLTA